MYTDSLQTAFLREQDMENKLVHMHDIVSKAHAVAKDNMLVRWWVHDRQSHNDVVVGISHAHTRYPLMLSFKRRSLVYETLYHIMQWNQTTITVTSLQYVLKVNFPLINICTLLLSVLVWNYNMFVLIGCGEGGSLTGENEDAGESDSGVLSGWPPINTLCKLLLAPSLGTLRWSWFILDYAH